MGVECVWHPLCWEQKPVSGVQGYKGPLRVGKGSTGGLWKAGGGYAGEGGEPNPLPTTY